MKQTTLNEIADILRRGISRQIKEIVLHHTWSPTAAQYKGLATWEAIRRYHMDVRGWSDIGYHYGVGPDGSYWALRPVERPGAHVLGRNEHTIGVALVGNFDVEDPERNGLPAAAQLFRTIIDALCLPLESIRFHREFQNKTCPGMLIDLVTFRRRVASLSATDGLRIILLPQNTVIDCRPVLESDRVRCDLRPLAEALGATVTDHIRDQRKIYVSIGGRTNEQ